MKHAWLLALAACYSPHAETGSPCSPAAPACPGDQVCVATGSGSYCEASALPPDAGLDAPVADAPNDAPPDNDRDHDGVLDGDDDCPDVANPDQHDEDADALGDACDPCPPSSNNTDGDGDGIGDDCDPDPSTAGGRIALFEGFGQGVPASWTTQGTWGAAADDALVVTPSGTVADATFPAFGTTEYVIAGFTVASTTGTGYRSAGVEDNVGTSYAIACAAMLTGAADTTPNDTLADLFRWPAGTALDRAGWGWAVGDQLYVAGGRAGTGYDCYGYDFATMAEGYANGSDATTSTNPRAGIRAVGAAVRFHWVMVLTP